MSGLSDLQAVPLFAGLPAEDLERIAEGVTEERLADGEVLFREGEPGDSAYVITSGEVEIVKQAVNREVLLAVQGPGTVIGEMALLREAPRMATGRVRKEVTLLRIPRATLDYVLDTSTAAARQMMNVVLDRWRENQAQLQQSERMAQLGTLTAGLAHELNNPAAAVARSAAGLAVAVSAHGAAFAAAVAAITTDEDRTELETLLGEAMSLAARPPDLDPLERSDRESEIEDWLVDLGVEAAWEIAPALVDLGYSPAELATVSSRFDDGAVAAIVRAIHAAASVGSLLHEVEEGAGRLSAIVKALKSYAYLDQAPVQNVDLTVGLDDTLLILKKKLEGITVRRSYDPGLPTIEAYGSELNQVWTNLLDNAADAIHRAGITGGEITIRAFPIEEGVAVEIADSGPGIPPEIQSRVFDSFFTTKPPGSGTGLGLDISRSIVMTRHGGTITLRSEPGTTVFRVELPLAPPG